MYVMNSDWQRALEKSRSAHKIKTAQESALLLTFYMIYISLVGLYQLFNVNHDNIHKHTCGHAPEPLLRRAIEGHHLISNGNFVKEPSGQIPQIV
jgi:hypothetical protein